MIRTTRLSGGRHGDTRFVVVCLSSVRIEAKRGGAESAAHEPMWLDGHENGRVVTRVTGATSFGDWSTGSPGIDC